MIVTVNQGEGRIHALVTPEAGCEVCEETGLVNAYDQFLIFGAPRESAVANDCMCVMQQIEHARGITDYEIIAADHPLAALLEQLGKWQTEKLDMEEQQQKREQSFDFGLSL